jgi:urate oxidase
MNLQTIDKIMVNQGWTIKKPSRTIDIMGESINLQKEKRMDVYSRFEELRGNLKPSQMGSELSRWLSDRYGDNTLRETLNQIVEGTHEMSYNYENMSNNIEREKALKGIIAIYTRAAKAIIREEYPFLNEMAVRRQRDKRELGELDEPLAPELVE